MSSSLEQPQSPRRSLVRALVLIALPIAVHLLTVRPVEPVFCGDSNRHVMTSIFFRDFLVDGQFTDPKGYAERYYEQYPALGLMIWPPLFHGVCGTLMLVFGTSVVVARGLVLVCCVASVWCVHRLARRAFDDDRAMAVAVLFSIAPLIFDYSRDVMLEVPALALVLLSVDQFDLWLRASRPRHLYIAAITAALAALTRFDAAVLLPFYGLLLCFRGAWSRLLNRHVMAAAAVAVTLVGPVYFVIAREAGELHLRQASTSVGGSEDGSTNGFLAMKNLTYYPLSLVEQCGWPITVLCVLGLLASLGRTARARQAVFLSLLLATWLTFSPLAELRARHAIYWVPAVISMAVCGVEFLLSRLMRLRQTSSGFRLLSGPAASVASYAVLFASTAVSAMNQPFYRVSGYEAAAELAIETTSSGDRVFFDGWWDGNFTYHMRHLDPSRSRTVLRGDKLLYDFVCVPGTDFHAHAENEVQILEELIKVRPALLVVENPQFFHHIEIAQRLRTLIATRPDIFPLVESISVESSLLHLPRFQLDVFRFNPDAAHDHLAQLAFSLPE